MIVEVTTKSLPAALRRTTAALVKAVNRGAVRGAYRGLALLRERTPVDQGQLRAAWKVRNEGGVVVIENDAPHMGIVERGARPHPVGHEGIVALWDWVWRHRQYFNLVTKSGRLQQGDAAKKAALGIAYAIARKIKLRGQKPTYFVRDSLDEVARFTLEEIMHATGRSLS